MEGLIIPACEAFVNRLRESTNYFCSFYSRNVDNEGRWTSGTTPTLPRTGTLPCLPVW